MDKNTIQTEIELIKEVLRRFNYGAGSEAIRVALGPGTNLRTVQRRLKELQSGGVITTTGQRRSTLYHLALPTILPTTSLVLEEPSAEYLANRSAPLISVEGVAIQKAIMAPEIARNPVGYNQAFLKGYRPNIDSYLTPAHKATLAKLGKTVSLHQPAGTYAREILQRLLIDLSWNSSRLEGNTYSLLDTQRLIAHGELADDKSRLDAQMILNHKEAIEFIVQSTDGIDFNRYTIMNLHALLSDNLLPDPISSGRLRKIGVGIGKSVYIPLAVPQVIEEMFDTMLYKAAQIEDPFEQAFFIMVQLPYLQPFDDVNKRVSRIAVNIPFNKHNLSPLSFVDVPHDVYIQGLLGVYELNRIELLRDVFMWAYERSARRYAAIRQALGEPDAFRMQHREAIRAVVAEVVSKALIAQRAVEKINIYAREVPVEERQKFIETVETELLSLHEGNFARYKIRPSEFNAWKDAQRK